MPKQNKELTTFITGTITTPSAEDTKPEAAIYSKNLEPLDEQGKLKGIKQDLKVKPINEGFSIVAYQIPSQGVFKSGDSNVVYTEEDGTTTTLDPESDATATYYDETQNTVQVVANKDVDHATNSSNYTEVYSLKNGDKVEVYNNNSLIGEATYDKDAVTGAIGSSSGTTTNKTFDIVMESSDVVTNLPIDQFNTFTTGQAIVVKNSADATIAGSNYTFDATTLAFTLLTSGLGPDTYTVEYTQDYVEEDAPYADSVYNWDGTTPKNKTHLKVSILNSADSNHGFSSIAGDTNTHLLTVASTPEDTIQDGLKGRIIRRIGDGAWGIIKSNKVVTTSIINDQGSADEAADPSQTDIGWYWEIEHTPLQPGAFDSSALNTPGSDKWEDNDTFTITGGNNQTWEALKKSLESHSSVDTVNLLTSEEDDPSDFSDEQTDSSLDDSEAIKSVGTLVSELTFETSSTATEDNDGDTSSNWTAVDVTMTNQSTDQAYSGSKSLKLAQNANPGYIYRTISTTANIWYKASFWVYKSNITNDVKYGVGTTTSQGVDIIAESVALTAAATWQQVIVRFKGTGSNVYIWIEPGENQAGDVAYIDDYTLDKDDVTYLTVPLDIPGSYELLNISRVYIDPTTGDDVEIIPNNTTGYYYDSANKCVKIFNSLISDFNLTPSELKVDYEQDSVAKDNLQYNNMQLTFNSDVNEIDVEIKRINGETTVSSKDASTHMRIDDATEYFQLDANQMIMFNEKDVQNIIFYSVTEEDTDVDTATYDNATNSWSGTVKTFRMKILTDIYEDPAVEAFWTDDDGNIVYNDIPTEPSGVTLQKSNAAIYVGTGNDDKALSKWYGRIFHTQFGRTIEGYVLDDSECYPIDDKSAVYNLDYTQQTYTNGLGFDNKYMFGITESTRKVHAVITGGCKDNATTRYGTDAAVGYGIQSELNPGGSGLGYKPGAIAPSVYITESMVTRTEDSSNSGSDWIFNDGSSSGCVWPPTNEHGSTTGYQNILGIEKQTWLDNSYSTHASGNVKELCNESGVYWVSNRSNNAKLTAYHFKMNMSDGDTGSHVTRADANDWELKDAMTGTKTFTIKYGHDISSGSGSDAFVNSGGTQERFQAKHYYGEYNTEKEGFISAAPPAGTYISDIMEVHNWEKFKPYTNNGVQAPNNSTKNWGFNTTKLYIQLSKKDGTGFGFEDDWLFCVDLGGMNDGKGPGRNDTILYAKPVTPPAMKMESKSPGRYGDKLYYCREMVDPHSWHHLGWVGHTGSYGGYSTSLHWRNCDELGYMTGGKHVLETSSNTQNFIRMRARTHSHYHMDQPGGLHIGVIGGNASQATSPNARDGAFPSAYMNMRNSGFVDDIQGNKDINYNQNYTSRSSFARNDSFSQNNKYGSFPPKFSDAAGQQMQHINVHSPDMEWGRPFGWLDTYSIKPARKGLVFLNNQNEFLAEEIGVLSYIQGKLIADKVEFNRSTRKRRKWRHRKKMSYLQQRSTITPRQFRNWCLVTANPWNLGVNQRCIPKDSRYICRSRNYYRNSSSVYNSYTDTYSTSYSWSVSSGGTNRLKASDSNMYAFRQGAYSGLDFDPADAFNAANNASKGSIQYAKLRHQIYMFKEGVTQTSMEGFENVAKLPQTSISINSMTSHIHNNSSLDTDNKFAVSYKDGNSNHSYISLWDFIHATKTNVSDSPDSASPISLPGSGLSLNSMTQQPLVLENFGNALITQRLRSSKNRNTLSDYSNWNDNYADANTPDVYDLTPRSGSYQIGRINLMSGNNSDNVVSWSKKGGTAGNNGDTVDGSIVTYAGNSTETGDVSEFNDYTTIYEGSMLKYGIMLNPIEATVDSGVSEADAIAAGYETVDEWHKAQNFPRRNQYYYKISLVYDGFQESPMNNYYFTVKTGEKSYANMLMDIKLAVPPLRVSAIAIYRKNNIEDYYRFVKEVALDGNWAEKDNQYIRIEIDDGILSGSYESINGVPETLRNTNVNYKLSCTGGGVLFAGNCWHPKIQNATNYVFKSQPGSFSIFDWTRDFLTLPSVPTSMVWYKGKLYVFDLNNTYRINAEMMAIEDTAEGTGCISNDSYIVTDTGLFFCDYSNMYMHTGVQSQPLGSNILRSSLLDDEGTKNYAWQNIDHNRDPVVSYDPKIQTVRFMFEDKDGFSGSWNYNIPQGRFDLVEYPIAQSVVSGARSEAYLSNGTNLMQLDAIHDKRKKWTYYTKTFNMETSTINKRFHNVKIVHLDPIEKLGTIEIWIDNHFTSLNDVAKKITTKSGQNESKYFTTTYKLASNKAKGKTIQIRIKDSETEVESIGIVYTSKRVK